MSLTALTWAWEQQGMQPSAKLVLLSLANYANSENISYPSKLTIARDTGLSHASVKRVIKTLSDYIEPIGTVTSGKTCDGKTRETVRYRLKVGKSTGVTVNRVHHEPGSFEQSTGFTMNPKPKDNQKNIYIYSAADISIDLPPEITHEQFNQFIQHRADLKKVDKRKKLNQRVAQLGLTQMLTLARQGEDLSACLNQMELKGWDQPYTVNNEKRGGANESVGRNTERNITAAEQLRRDGERARQRLAEYERNRAGGAGPDDAGTIDGEFYSIR